VTCDIEKTQQNDQKSHVIWKYPKTKKLRGKRSCDLEQSEIPFRMIETVTWLNSR